MIYRCISYYTTTVGPLVGVKCVTVIEHWSSVSLKYFISSSRIFSTTTVATNKQTYYDILGLKPNCAQKEIRAAYLELCKKYHPDKLNASTDISASQKQVDNNARFQKITEAYDCLSKVNERSRYDLSLHGVVGYRSGESRGRDWYRQDPQQQYQHMHRQYVYMHHRYRNQNKNDFTDPEFKVLGTTFVTLIISSLVIVTILQAYDKFLELETRKLDADIRYQTISRMYNLRLFYRTGRHNHDLFHVMDMTNKSTSEEQVDSSQTEHESPSSAK